MPSVVTWLGEASVDLIEISGGNYEKPAMMGSGAKESTVRREAYFLDYARSVRQVATVPIMLTAASARSPRWKRRWQRARAT